MTDVESGFREGLLGDPLSDVTRKERRSLLGISVVAIVIVKTGLVPTEITNLGIKFSPAEKGALLKVLAAVVAYYLLAFLVYAVSDFQAWSLNAQRETTAPLRDWLRKPPAERGAEPPVVSSGWFFGLLLPVDRGLVELALPLAVAGYAILSLIHAW